MVSNKLNITFHVVLSQSSHHVMHLWHHHQSIVTSVGSTERKQSKWDRESMCENHLFIAMYGFIMLYVRNNTMCVLFCWTVSMFTRVLFWCYFLRCFTTRSEIKILKSHSFDHINGSPLLVHSWHILYFYQWQWWTSLTPLTDQSGILEPSPPSRSAVASSPPAAEPRFQLAQQFSAWNEKLTLDLDELKFYYGRMLIVTFDLITPTVGAESKMLIGHSPH